jgi:hypothetical protein
MSLVSLDGVPIPTQRREIGVDCDLAAARVELGKASLVGGRVLAP